MDPVQIFGFSISTWTRTACMTCIEKGVEYELLPIDRGSPAHRELHPFGRMPILRAGGVTIPESLAITGYLDEAFPGPALQPAEPEARARMRTWMGICGDYLFRDIVRGIPRGRAADEEQLVKALSALAAAEALVGDGPFLVGESLTLADLYLAPQIANCLEKAPSLLEGLDGLNRWTERITTRPSFTATAP